VIPKLHRLDTHRSPWRGITGKSGKNVIGDSEPLSKPEAFSSRLGADVASGLNSCIDLIINSELGAKIRKCWICRDSQELIDVFGVIPRNVDGLKTIDFKTKYTQLKHKDLKAGLLSALHDVRDILARKFEVTSDVAWTHCAVCASKDGPIWTLHDNEVKRETMSLKNLFAASRTIIDNCFTYTGGIVFLQLIGLPMGAEPSPPLANLYFYSLEKKFVEKQVEAFGEDEVIKRYHGFRFHLRYIDDLIMPDLDEAKAPGMTEADYGGCLYSITGRGVRVVFLGIQVEKEKNKSPIFKAQDKQQFFDFTVVRFPTWYTCVPRHVRVGTLTGMLVRTLRLTTANVDFFTEVKYLYSLFKARQYKLDEMKAGIQKFLAKHVKSRYHADFRRFSDPLLAEWDDPTPIVLPEPPKPPKPAAISTASQADDDISAELACPTLEQLRNGAWPPPPPARAPPEPLVVPVPPPPPTPTPGLPKKKKMTFNFKSKSVIEKPSAEFKNADHLAVSSVAGGGENNQLAILDSNGAIQEPSSHELVSYSSTTTTGGGHPDKPVEVHHYHHHVHEAPAAQQPVVNHVYNDNRTQVAGDQYLNSGTVNNYQMNGGQNFGTVNQNFGTVNQQQNNNCDVLTGNLQQTQQLEYHQHLQIAPSPNQHNNNQQLQIQDSAAPPRLMIEDARHGRADPTVLLLGAPPSAQTDNEQQSAQVRQDQSLLGKAGNSGTSPVVVSSGDLLTPSAASLASHEAPSLNRACSQNRERSTRRAKRKRQGHGLVTSSSAAGSVINSDSEVNPSSGDDNSSSPASGKHHSCE
jgi:hypothetical protein